MIRKAFVVVALLALIACERKTAAPPPAAAAQETGTEEKGNLLNLGFGASVVSRTAEMHLLSSAVSAIDGLPSTRWISSPGGPEQTLVFSLAAPTRVRQLGLVTSADPAEVAKRVRFSASTDGKTWRDVLTIEPHAGKDAQRTAVAPFVAQYIRVDTEYPGGYFAALTSVQVLGDEVAAAQRRAVTGCWTINGYDAQLVQQGARVVGIIRTPTPTYLEGGTNGRVLRFQWLRGPAFGYAAVTLGPDSATLSGLTFYEDPVAKQVGDAWFGTRCDRPLQPESAPIGALLARAGKWELYGLAFDAQDRLDPAASRSTLDALAALIRREPSHRFRVVAHELRGTDPEQNRRHSVVRTQGLRAALQARGVDFAHIELVAAGGGWSGEEIVSAVQRLLLSSVTLERVQ